MIYVLFTNLDYVKVGDVRTMTHALLLERRHADSFIPHLTCMARGFGVDPAWPTFDVAIGSLEYELVQKTNVSYLNVAPCYFELWHTCNSHDPNQVDIDEFPDGASIDTVWLTLVRKCAKHWTAPYMPTLKHQPVELMRRLAKRASYR